MREIMKMPIGSINAREWAEAFIEEFRESSEMYQPNDLHSWFANAIMAGYDHALNVTPKRRLRCPKCGNQDRLQVNYYLTDPPQLNKFTCPICYTETKSEELKNTN